MPVEKNPGVRSGQIIAPAIPRSRQGYLERMRRILFFAEEPRRVFVYLTNNFALPALITARLSEAAASGTVLQVDQATAADQTIRGHVGQRG